MDFRESVIKMQVCLVILKVGVEKARRESPDRAKETMHNSPGLIH